MNWLFGIFDFSEIKFKCIYIYFYKDIGAQRTRTNESIVILITVFCHAKHKILSDGYASIVTPYCAFAMTFLFRSGIYIVLTVSILPQLSHIDTECREYDIHVIALILTYLLSDPYSEKIRLNVYNIVTFLNLTIQQAYGTEQNVISRNDIKEDDISNLYRNVGGHYRDIITDHRMSFLSHCIFYGLKWIEIDSQ